MKNLSRVNLLLVCVAVTFFALGFLFAHSGKDLLNPKPAYANTSYCGGKDFPGLASVSCTTYDSPVRLTNGKTFNASLDISLKDGNTLSHINKSPDFVTLYIAK